MIIPVNNLQAPVKFTVNAMAVGSKYRKIYGIYLRCNDA